MSQNTSTNSPDNGDHNKHPSFPSADRVREKLQKEGATVEQISSALWLLDYARRNRVRTYQALGDVIGRNASAISKLFSGSYGADPKGLIRLIDNVRLAEIERAGFGDKPIVETSVTKDVATLCDLTRSSQTIAFLYGLNQSGKTEAIQKYTRENNHGRTIYVRMRAGGGAKMFLQDLLTACGISDRKSYIESRDRVLRFFGYKRPGGPRNSHLLLIVDEFHQAMIGRNVKTVTIELIREIFDLCGCGVVLCGTEVLPDMIQDVAFEKLLGQLANRGVLRRRIPKEPSLADVNKICAAYGLDEPEGRALKYVRTICQENGIGKLCGYLRMAKNLAHNRHLKLAWEHFLTTKATLDSWQKDDPKFKELKDRSEPAEGDE